MRISLKLLIVMLMTVWTHSAGAQASAGKNEDKPKWEYTISGRVTEAFEGVGMGGVAVELMSADSIVLATTTTKTDTADNIFARYNHGTFEIKAKALGQYILKFSHVGYSEQFVNVRLRYKRETNVRIDDVLLSKNIVMLDEVEIQATKVKMVVKGDTVVYNADAFHLAEGSMLDELIKQLPGAEIKEGGKIYVNGKYVESLMVNGKDFFTGDPSLAMRNLPAYSVNKIKVYDQRGEKSELMGKDMDDKSYVMDVRLKKAYSRGNISSLEGAVGTDRRYNVKGMAMLFSDVTRKMVYGSSNNLGKDQTYDATWDNWSEDGIPTADASYHNGGFSYQYQPSEGVKSNKFVTSNNISYSDVNSKNWSSTQTFLEGGDTYGRSYSLSGNKSISITSNNSLAFWGKKSFLNFDLNGSYNKNDNTGERYNAIFSANPTGLDNLQEDVFGADGNKFEDISTNRSKSLSESFNKTYSISANGGYMKTLFGDLMYASAEAAYDEASRHGFSLDKYDYYLTGQHDLRNKYTETPNRNLNLKATAGYHYSITQEYTLKADYRFGHQHNKSSNWLYRLDKLEEYSELNPYNVLPSTSEALSKVVDAPNSYTYNQYNTENLLTLGASRRIEWSKEKSLMVSLDLPLHLRTNSLSYFRVQDYDITQNSFNIEPMLVGEYRNDGFQTGFNVRYIASLPAMTSLITFRDDSNPLYISNGNPDLKNTHTLSVSANADHHKQRWGFSLNYSRTFDAVATASVYDKTTGVTTATPTNINGNWNIDGRFHMNKDLDEKKRFNIANIFNAGYHHSVDMNSVAGSAVSTRSTVNNLTIGDLFVFNWEISKAIRFKAYAADNYRHQSSRREGFTTVNAHDMVFGGEIVAELPWKLQLSTTAKQTMRRGYSDQEMNTDELVWDASIKRPFLQGRLLVSLEGYDILGQRTNRNYTLNAQGRTESYSDIIPSYAMLRLTYRFTKIPKKKDALMNNAPIIIK